MKNLGFDPTACIVLFWGRVSCFPYWPGSYVAEDQFELPILLPSPEL